MTDQPPNRAHTVVIGTGNPYRRDDAVGLLVARALAPRLEHRARVLEREGEATELMAAWEGFDLAVVIDAVRDRGHPGRIYCFDPDREDLPRDLFCYSTHAVGVAEAITLSQALGSRPRALRVYGIAGEDFTAGVGLSPSVQAAVGRTAERILEDLGLHTGETHARDVPDEKPHEEN